MENIFLFLGEEELIIHNKIEKEITLSKADIYNIKSYDLEEVNVTKALNDAETAPFLSESKVIILKNPLFLTNTNSDIKHNVKAFIRYLKDPTPTTILIIDATNLNLDDSKEVVQVLKKEAQISTTKKLSQIEAEGWLKRQFFLLNITIKDETVRLFFNRIGKNLLNAKNEVDKLLNYIGEAKIVTNKDVCDVVIKEIESDAFALTNAIVAQDREKTISIYEDLIQIGKSPIELFSLIAKSLILLMVTKKMLREGYKQPDIASKLKVSSGRSMYLIKDAKAFSWQVLEDNILRLGDLDYKIKSGQIDATTGIEFLLFNISNTPRAVDDNQIDASVPIPPPEN